jgi:predicted ATPase
MKLLKITLKGQYKSLRKQEFDFTESNGSILAFIGLNGSGKSQLLELICECFSWCERVFRSDFEITKEGLGFGFQVTWELNGHCYTLGTLGKETIIFSTSDSDFYKNNLNSSRIEPNTHHIFDIENIDDYLSILNILPNYIIGYASGLNENLQRSFMKNTAQYFNVMDTRSLYKELRAESGDVESIVNLNMEFSHEYPGIFDVNPFPKQTDRELQLIKENEMEGKYVNIPKYDYAADLIEKETKVSRCIYLDYDCNALLLCSLSILSRDELSKIFPFIEYCIPDLIKIRYDLRNNAVEEDAVRDIQKLCKLVGSSYVEGDGEPSSEHEYEIYGLNNLAGYITINIGNESVREVFNDAYFGNPLTLFLRLYRIQQLGVKNWSYEDRENLKSDCFFGNVKKPLKTRLPLSVMKLTLSNSSNKVIDFNDLSDGESQLIQILGAARLFRDEEALIILDEPETHLNPAWRTNFHKYLSEILFRPKVEQQTPQVIISTHSPFFISSLPEQDVYCFRRLDNNIIMEAPPAQTYGASFDVLVKQHFGLKSLISQSAVEKIREKIEEGDEEALRWIKENLGMSSEKAYLLKKLNS